MQHFVGETIDLAAQFGAKGILFVAHLGKFVKVAGGIMNTHSGVRMQGWKFSGRQDFGQG